MEHDNTNELRRQQTSPMEQPESNQPESRLSQIEVDTPNGTTTRKLGKRGVRAARLSEEQVARIEELTKLEALMREPPEGVDRRKIEEYQAREVESGGLDDLRPPLRVSNK